MIDIYQRLGFRGLAPRAITRRMIEGALRQPEVPEDIRLAAESILLNEARSGRYLRTVEYLRAVGEVRSIMGLQPTDCWPAGTYVDFEIAPPEVGVSEKKTFSWVGFIFALVIVSICAALIWGALASEDAGYRMSRPPSARVERHADADLVWKESVQSAPTYFDTKNPSSPETGAEPVKFEELAFDAPAQPLPRTGIMTPFTKRGVAPLEIITKGGLHHYVKIVPLGGGDACTVFIRAGGRAEFLVPVGTYELRYAVGSIWYGREHLFGPSTECSEADDLFVFTFDGRTYSGYTVELYLQAFGNLETNPIPLDQF